MIDYLKMQVIDPCVSEILKNPNLEFTGTHSLRTGEIFNDRRANYKNMIIHITRYGQVYVSGSIHKFYTFDEEAGCGYNHGDFSLTHLRESLGELAGALKVRLECLKLRNVEFGVNVQYELPILNELSLYLVIHKAEAFSELKNSSGRFIGRQVTHRQYIYKAYEKGIQYNLKYNEFRIEIKVVKMEYLTRKIDRSLFANDLKDVKILELMGKELIRVWKDTIVYDSSVDLEQMSRPACIFFCDAQNPIYWQVNKFKGDDLRNRKRRYRSIIEQFSCCRVHQNVQVLINDKIQELIDKFSTSDNKSNCSEKGYESRLTFFDLSVKRSKQFLIIWAEKIFHTIPHNWTI